MKRLAIVIADISAFLDRVSAAALPTLARLIFAGVLLTYFWASGMTKLGPGPFTPSSGAYVQIFPRLMEAAGYDTSQLALWHRLVVLAGTWAEFVLPLLIVVGLATRFAAFGMIAFVLVQTVTDRLGHGVPWGAWFDRAPDAALADQRSLWIFMLLVLVLKGAGPWSLDRLIRAFFRQS